MKKFIVVSAIAAGLSSPSVFAQTQEPPKEPQQKPAQQTQQPNAQPSNKPMPSQTEKKPQDSKARQTQSDKEPKSKQTQTEPADKKQPKSTETKPAKEQPKSTQSQPAQPNQKQTGTKPNEQPKQTQNQPADQKGKVQLSADQRTKVEQEVRKQNFKSVSNVNVRIEIGSRVPRSVRLYAMPAALITLVPEYRTYRVVVINDEICIVDPRSYAIVEVVGGRMQRPTQQTAVLELSADERMIVIREAKWDDARADIQVRLGLGAEVPSTVKVVEFDDRIVKDVPKLKGYKYVTVGQDLVIVDDRRNVALMLTR